jgi:hypothetical protein
MRAGVVVGAEAGMVVVGMGVGAAEVVGAGAQQDWR